MIRLFIIMLVTLFSPISGADEYGDQPIDPSINPSAIYDFLFQKNAPAYGYGEFFKEADKEVSEHFEQYVPSSQEGAFSEFRQQGLNFQKKYMEKLREDFSEISLGYVTNFESQVILRIQELMAQTKKRKFENKLSDLEREAMAFRMAVPQASLKGINSIADLDRDKHLDFANERAMDTFRRQNQRLQEFTKYRPASAKRSLTEIKDILVDEIRQARTENFLGAMQYSESLKQENYVTIQNRRSVPKFEEVAQLLFSKKSNWDPLQSVTVTSSIFKKVRKTLGLDPNKRKDKDLSSAKNFYSPDEYSPGMPELKVQVLLKNGESIVISESDFSKWINGLRHPDTEDLFGKDRFEKRYLVEASARDAMLSDLESVLRSDESVTVQKLLDVFLEIEKDSKSQKAEYVGSLTEKIRSLPLGSAFNAHFFNGIRWAGWAIHPDYWTIRGAYAWKYNKPHISELIGTDDTGAEDREVVKIKRVKEFLNRKHRTSRQALRSVMLPVPAAMITAVFGIAGGFGLELLFPGSNGNGYELSKVWHAEREGHGIFERGHQNIVMDVSNPSGTNIPRFFNMAIRSNYPEDVLRDTNPDSEPDSVIPHKVEYEWDDTEGLFSVESHLAVKPLENKISIITIPGYKVGAIQFYRANSKEPIENWRDEFAIYQIPSNGLIYADIKDRGSYWGGVSYSIKYIKDDRVISSTSEFESLNQNIVGQIAQELKKTGEIDISNGIRTSMAFKGDSYSILDLAGDFSRNSTWTPKALKKSNFGSIFKILDFSLGGDAEPGPFSEYKQYLYNGRYFYQCTGATSLISKTINMYAEKSDVPIQAEGVSGYSYKGAEYVRNSDAHSHSIVSHTKKPWTYLQIDTSPAEDPAFIYDAINGKNNKEENPSSEHLRVWGLQRSSQKTNIKKPEVDEEKKTHSKSLEERIEKDQYIKYVEMILTGEASLNKLLAGAEDIPYFSMKSSKSLPIDGIRLLNYSELVKKMLLGELALHQATIQLLALDSGYSRYKDLGTYKENKAGSQYREKLDKYIEAQMNEGRTRGDLIKEVFIKYTHRIIDLKTSVESEIVRSGESTLDFAASRSWMSAFEELRIALMSLPYGELFKGQEVDPILKVYQGEPEAPLGVGESLADIRFRLQDAFTPMEKFIENNIELEGEKKLLLGFKVVLEDLLNGSKSLREVLVTALALDAGYQEALDFYTKRETTETITYKKQLESHVDNQVEKGRSLKKQLEVVLKNSGPRTKNLKSDLVPLSSVEGQRALEHINFQLATFPLDSVLTQPKPSACQLAL